MKIGDKVKIIKCDYKIFDRISLVDKTGKLTEYYPDSDDEKQCAVAILFDDNPIPEITNRPIFLWPVEVVVITDLIE